MINGDACVQHNKVELDEEEKRYYEKHMLLNEIGEEGQLKLKNAKVLVIGAGGLGCPALLYLATAGVGCIGMVDLDVVSESNLHRQVLYTFDNLGEYKAEAAAARLKKVNPYIKLNYYTEKVDSSNIESLIDDYDIILDAPDNYDTRYAIEDACTKHKKTVVYASVFRFQGQVTVFDPSTACFRCVFPENPVDTTLSVDSKNGIFAPLTGIIGAIQASEAIKVITNIGRPLKNVLLCYNAMEQSIKTFKLHKNSLCPVCGNKTE